MRSFLLMTVPLLVPATAWSYTPTDPIVQEMVQGGINHLEEQIAARTHNSLSQPFEGGMGERVLAGYAHMKVMHDPSNAVVKQGLVAARSIVNGLPGKDPGGHSSLSIYNLGVCAMLIAEVSPPDKDTLLARINDLFIKYQFRGGGYGYLGSETGDVSQTQYAMLGLWTISRSGIPVDYKGVSQTLNWLLRVQDPSGGWPYQGIDPGPRGRVPQTRVTASMGVAGGSALLIGGDIVRAWGDAFDDDDPKIPGLPKAVKLAVEEKLSIPRIQFPTEPLLKSTAELETWLKKNSPDPAKLPSVWPYYQLYTVERYESFKEVAFQLPKDPSPDWYNAGVEYLKTKQLNGGGYQPDLMTSGVATSFAILFLIRSTQKSIQSISKGTLAGGYGLPKDTTNITVSGTQIKGEPAASAVGDLLSLLEGDDPDKLETNSIPENLKLATAPEARRIQIDRLERLVRGSQSWQARRVAARLLGQSDELKVVPALIFALSDPDSLVKRYANDGLAFISRRFQTFPLPDKPSDEDIRRAQQAWREWFLSVQPNYVFLDQAF